MYININEDVRTLSHPCVCADATAGFKHAEPATDDPSVMMALLVNLDPVCYPEWREGFVHPSDIL